MSIRKLGSEHDPNRKFGVVYTIIDGDGMLPEGTEVAWGWKFATAWRYTVQEAEEIVAFINSCFDDPKRMARCCAITVPYPKAQQAAMNAAAIVSKEFKRRCDAKKRNANTTLEERMRAKLMPAQVKTQETNATTTT